MIFFFLDEVEYSKYEIQRENKAIRFFRALATDPLFRRHALKRKIFYLTGDIETHIHYRDFGKIPTLEKKKKRSYALWARKNSKKSVQSVPYPPLLTLNPVPGLPLYSSTPFRPTT